MGPQELVEHLKLTQEEIEAISVRTLSGNGTKTDAVRKDQLAKKIRRLEGEIKNYGEGLTRLQVTAQMELPDRSGVKIVKPHELILFIPPDHVSQIDIPFIQAKLSLIHGRTVYVTQLHFPSLDNT